MYVLTPIEHSSFSISIILGRCLRTSSLAFSKLKNIFKIYNIIHRIHNSILRNSKFMFSHFQSPKLCFEFSRLWQNCRYSDIRLVVPTHHFSLRTWPGSWLRFRWVTQVMSMGMVRQQHRRWLSTWSEGVWKSILTCF